VIHAKASAFAFIVEVIDRMMKTCRSSPATRRWTRPYFM